MNITIYPKKLSGTVRAIPSKSQAHRLLICAAFADRQTEIICPQTNQDIEATADCLNAIGANILRTKNGYMVQPVTALPAQAALYCRESGSTLRFMLPICCALGVDAVLHMEGRLPNRPLTPMWEELERMGCRLSRPTENTIRTTGRLGCGNYNIPGNISSQFISGLLFATALMDGSSTITVAGKAESLPYIRMTQKALACFGVSTENYQICGQRPFTSPGTLTVEGDWSNAAFFLAAKALGNSVHTHNLDSKSPQGDRQIAELLANTAENPTISAADIPDLVPILSVFYASRNGATITDIQRLRLKESDRVASVCKMIRALGADAVADDTTLRIYPGRFHSCTIDAENDHRIAMSAAIAATVSDGPVTVVGADCVAKSYPSFWEEYAHLGGHYE